MSSLNGSIFLDCPDPNPVYLLITNDGKHNVMFEGNIYQFEDTYGGGWTPGNEEGFVVNVARQENCRVFKRVDTEYEP
jgi:hypothetical protein